MNIHSTSMDELSFAQYQAESRQTAIYPAIGGETEIYPALELANEAGEVLGVIKKVYRDKNGQYNSLDLDKIADELGDTLWSLSQLATDLGLDLQDIAERNLNKLKSRQERGVLGGSGGRR